MDPESKELLEKTLSLAEENNKLLHKVRRVQKWETFWQALKIIVIVGIALGAFYYLEPYLDKVVGVYKSISAAEQKISNAGNSFQGFFGGSEENQ